MDVLRAGDFTGTRAWEARHLAAFGGTTTAHVHWTDQPYHWHVNDGVETFTVLSGNVRMHYRTDGRTETSVDLAPGDTFVADEGDEHCAEPLGPARILVVERADSE